MGRVLLVLKTSQSNYITPNPKLVDSFLFTGMLQRTSGYVSYDLENLRTCS
jgi:hypothetical protein